MLQLDLFGIVYPGSLHGFIYPLLIDDLTFIDSPGSSSTSVSGKSEKFSFEFDHVFTDTSSQESVFEEVSQLVQSSIDGYNVCIFAYG